MAASSTGRSISSNGSSMTPTVAVSKSSSSPTPTFIPSLDINLLALLLDVKPAAIQDEKSPGINCAALVLAWREKETSLDDPEVKKVFEKEKLNLSSLTLSKENYKKLKSIADHFKTEKKALAAVCYALAAAIPDITALERAAVYSGILVTSPSAWLIHVNNYYQKIHPYYAEQKEKNDLDQITAVNQIAERMLSVKSTKLSAPEPIVGCISEHFDHLLKEFIARIAQYHNVDSDGQHQHIITKLNSLSGGNQHLTSLLLAAFVDFFAESVARTGAGVRSSESNKAADSNLRICLYYHKRSILSDENVESKSPIVSLADINTHLQLAFKALESKKEWGHPEITYPSLDKKCVHNPQERVNVCSAYADFLTNPVGPTTRDGAPAQSKHKIYEMDAAAHYYSEALASLASLSNLSPPTLQKTAQKIEIEQKLIKVLDRLVDAIEEEKFLSPGDLQQAIKYLQKVESYLARIDDATLTSKLRQKRDGLLVKLDELQIKELAKLPFKHSDVQKFIQEEKDDRVAQYVEQLLHDIEEAEPLSSSGLQKAIENLQNVEPFLARVVSKAIPKRNQLLAKLNEQQIKELAKLPFNHSDVQKFVQEEKDDRVAQYIEQFLNEIEKAEPSSLVRIDAMLASQVIQKRTQLLAKLNERRIKELAKLPFNHSDVQAFMQEEKDDRIAQYVEQLLLKLSPQFPNIYEIVVKICLNNRYLNDALREKCLMRLSLQVIYPSYSKQAIEKLVAYYGAKKKENEAYENIAMCWKSIGVRLVSQEEAEVNISQFEPDEARLMQLYSTVNSLSAGENLRQAFLVLKEEIRQIAHDQSFKHRLETPSPTTSSTAGTAGGAPEDSDDSDDDETRTKNDVTVASSGVGMDGVSNAEAKSSPQSAATMTHSASPSVVLPSSIRLSGDEPAVIIGGIVNDDGIGDGIDRKNDDIDDDIDFDLHLGSLPGSLPGSARRRSSRRSSVNSDFSLPGSVGQVDEDKEERDDEILDESLPPESDVRGMETAEPADLVVSAGNNSAQPYQSLTPTLSSSVTNNGYSSSVLVSSRLSESDSQNRQESERKDQSNNISLQQRKNEKLQQLSEMLEQKNEMLRRQSELLISKNQELKHAYQAFIPRALVEHQHENRLRLRAIHRPKWKRWYGYGLAIGIVIGLSVAIVHRIPELLLALSGPAGWMMLAASLAVSVGCLIHGTINRIARKDFDAYIDKHECGYQLSLMRARNSQENDLAFLSKSKSIYLDKGPVIAKHKAAWTRWLSRAQLIGLGGALIVAAKFLLPAVAAALSGPVGWGLLLGGIGVFTFCIIRARSDRKKKSKEAEDMGRNAKDEQEDQINDLKEKQKRLSKERKKTVEFERDLWASISRGSNVSMASPSQSLAAQATADAAGSAMRRSLFSPLNVVGGAERVAGVTPSSSPGSQ